MDRKSIKIKRVREMVGRLESQSPASQKYDRAIVFPAEYFGSHGGKYSAEPPALLGAVC